MTGSTRDPVSVAFDASARRLLAKAYASPREWVQVWLPDPTIRQRTRFLSAGVNVDGPDPLPKGGGVDAKTRWARGFVRAVYYQHKWFYAQGELGSDRRMTPNDSRGLQYELGRMTLRGRAVRIRTRPGGSAAMKAVKRMPDQRRIYQDDGSPGGRWADPAVRDW